jgi:hypothetical protein
MLTKRTTILTAIFLLSLSSAVKAQPSSNSTHLLNNCTRTQSGSYEPDAQQNLVCIRQSIKCFSLPYGGIGFLSHCLTIYSLITNSLGVRGLMPWRLQRFRKADIGLSVVSLIGTIVPAIITLKRCSGQNVVNIIPIGSLCLSVGSSIAGAAGTGAWLFQGWKNLNDNAYYPSATYGDIYNTVSENERAKWGQRLTYFVVGLLLLTTASVFLLSAMELYLEANEASSAVVKATWGTLVPIFLMGLLSIGMVCTNLTGRRRCNCMSALLKFSLLVLFGSMIWMDWLLASIMENNSGMPYALDKMGKAAYWIYFISKRLPMFSV